MIKKVVNKPKKIVKKSHRPNESKIYVYDCDSSFWILKKNDKYFYWVPLDNTASYFFDYYDSFNEAFLSLDDVYVLNDKKELAHFILGARDFLTVKEMKEEAEEPEEPLADDEVDIKDCREDKIYALNQDNSGKIYKLTKTHEPTTFEFISLSNTKSWCGERRSDIKNCLKDSFFLWEKLDKQTVYQFDTQEELLRWALEQATGEKNEQ